jgi:ribosomal protein L6P/L9E
LYGIFLLKSFLGYYKNFIQYLKLKGMGYKITTNYCSLVFKLSQSHRLVYKIQRNIKITFLHKQALILKSKSLHLLKNIVFFLQKFGKKNAYKKKGIFFKGMIISVKVNSKKSKF